MWKKILFTVVLSLVLVTSFPLVSFAQPGSSGLQQSATHSIFIPVIGEPVSQQPITTDLIADHTRIASFTSIPLTRLQAAAGIKALFMHASTGSNIDALGFRCLAGLQTEPSNFPSECIAYATAPYSPYDNRNWNWPLWSDTTANAITKTNQWVSVFNAQKQNYQVLGMKYCYVDSYNLDFNYYKTAMEQLESANPQKKLIWATSVLYARSQLEVPGFVINFPNANNIKSFNQQLRAYAKANNKILYDLADIESHDPNGNACVSSTGHEMLCDAYSTGYGGGGGGHPNVDGSIRMAKGFWWLMARIAGWDGK